LLVRGPKAETNEAAEKKYHELMSAMLASGKTRNPGEILAKHLIDRFLVWTKEYLKPEQLQLVVAAIREDDQFLDVAWFRFESGARPQDLRGVTAADFEGSSRKLVLKRGSSKGGRDRRVVRLEGRALAIVTRPAYRTVTK
jgi:hypothetical protein